MLQLITGMHDMLKVNIIHRDLKLENIMMHFPQRTKELVKMDKEIRKKFNNEIQLDDENFEIKIADFGFSKKIKL